MSGLPLGDDRCRGLGTGNLAPPSDMGRGHIANVFEGLGNADEQHIHEHNDEGGYDLEKRARLDEHCEANQNLWMIQETHSVTLERPSSKKS